MTHPLISKTRVVQEMYDHLLEHPFFDVTIRRILNLTEFDDPTENTEYWRLKTELIDQTLLALIALNSEGSRT